MTDFYAIAAVVSLPLNAVLLIAYAKLYERYADAEHEAVHLKRYLDAAQYELADQARRNCGSVRRDPKTGRYLKNRSN